MIIAVTKGGVNHHQPLGIVANVQLVGDSHAAHWFPALERVAKDEGRLDVLVNNAATTKVIPHKDLEALTDELFDRILQTNVRGAFATVRAFRKLLAADGGGLIVNVSSLAARMAGGSNIAYCASKAGLDNMTLSLARALAPEASPA